MNMNRYRGAVPDLLSKKDLLKKLIYRIADGREVNQYMTTVVFHIVKACKLAKELLEIPEGRFDALEAHVPGVAGHSLLLRQHVQGLPARQELRRRRGVPLLRLAPHLTDWG